MKQMKLYTEDEDGDGSTTQVWVDDASAHSDADMVAIRGSFEAATHANLYKAALQNREVIAGDAAAAGAYDIADKAVFVFSTSDGREYEMTVPCPEETIFSDSDHVNLANADVLAFETAALAIGVAPGNPDATLVDLLRGYRIRSNRASI